MNDEATLMAMCWFQKSEWLALKEIDPESMDDSYEEWLKNANRAISDLRADGAQVKKIAVRVHELQAWCKENRTKPDSPTRSKFAIYKLQQRLALSRQ